jgi:hypothetical protein
LIDDCHRRKYAESNRSTKPTAEQVKSEVEPEEELMKELPTDLLYSSGEDVRQIRVEDTGSHPHYAHVTINGVPVEGIVDRS